MTDLYIGKVSLTLEQRVRNDAYRKLDLFLMAHPVQNIMRSLWAAALGRVGATGTHGKWSQGSNIVLPLHCASNAVSCNTISQICAKLLAITWVKVYLDHPAHRDFLCFPEIHYFLLTFNPRLTGGGRLTPPLPNIRDSSKTNSAIDVKLGRPSHTTIWHRPWKFFWNPSEIFWDMVDFVTSLHATFGRKLAKLRGSVEDAVFNKNANEKTPKDVKWEALQDGYLGFSKFWVFEP